MELPAQILEWTRKIQRLFLPLLSIFKALNWEKNESCVNIEEGNREGTCNAKQNIRMFLKLMQQFYYAHRRASSDM